VASFKLSCYASQVERVGLDYAKACERWLATAHIRIPRRQPDLHVNFLDLSLTLHRHSVGRQYSS
jgi:hypothetical protein